MFVYATLYSSLKKFNGMKEVNYQRVTAGKKVRHSWKSIVHLFILTSTEELNLLSFDI